MRQFFLTQIAAFAVVLLILPFAVNASDGIERHPYYRQYTVDDGLPSSEVYHAFQDSKGYIWFATANGVSRFDGNNFQNFDMNDGLVDNVVFEIYEDYKGRIWFIPYTCMLCYYEDGVIKPYKHNKRIKDKINNVLGPVKMSFRVDSLDNVTLSIKCFGIMSISEEGVIHVYDDGPYAKANVVIDGRNKDVILAANHTVPMASICYFDEKKELILSDSRTRVSKCVQQVYCVRANDSTIYLHLSGATFKICGDTIQNDLKNGALCVWLSVDRNNYLWFSNSNGGILAYPNANLEEEPVMSLFSDSRILSVLQDSEGSYWFTSQSDGVFYVPNFRVEVLTKQNGLQDYRIGHILYSNEKLYVGYQRGFVDVISKNNNVERIIEKSRLVPYVRSLYFDSVSNGVLACGLMDITHFKGNEHSMFLKTSTYVREIINSCKGGYWVSHKFGFDKYVDGQKVFSSNEEKKFRFDISSIIEDKSGVVWFSTLEGLWRFDGKNFQNLAERSQLLSRKSGSMFFHPKDSSIWIATNGLGVVVYEQNGAVWNITANDGLKTNSVNSIVYSPEGVWAATAKGLSLIKEIGRKNFDISTYTMSDGMPTNEITSVAVSSNYVFAGSSAGLAIFEKSTVPDNIVPPSVYITSVEVDDVEMNYNGEVPIVLDYDQNSLSFKYVSLSYRNFGNSMYRYRMVGFDTTWSYTKSRSCIYMGLKPGKYTFQVQSQNSSEIWCKDGDQVQIIVNEPFWATTWFMVTMMVLLLATLILFYRLRVISIQKRNKIMNSVSLYKQQSLRQQMNPHFIFNTLGSIQYYILNNDPISSHKYLTKFALLMRMTLENSQTPVITLNDEVESLKTYLELEALRLEEKFSYSINCQMFERIKDVKVPTLLIQPFVENAIWHGIMLKPMQDGHVSIDIVEEDDSIVIVVDDDGVGRDEARKIRERSANSGRKSRGYQITQQRIKLLNTIYENRFKIVTKDKFDNEGHSLGTTVTITFPREVKFDNLDFQLDND